MNNVNHIDKPEILEQMCEDFLKRIGTGSEMIKLFCELIKNMGSGDTCLELNDAQVEEINNSFSEITGLNELFILDGKKLFTKRYWNYEQTIREKLEIMKGKIAEDTVIPDDPVFSKLHDCQKQAVKMMVENRFSILTGGPGTGKTYTIARAVKLALQKGSLNIGLAAPTGKAAARVNETMEQEIRNLNLTGIIEKAVTLHTLLESTHTLVSFKHNRSNPLDLDWVIIDESSMVDLPLMAKLLDALPEKCRLTLVGDEHQLASVQPGRVFSDLCHLPGIPKCELNQSSRFPEGGTIDCFAKAVNSGNGESVLKILKTENELLHFTEFSGQEQTSPRHWPGFQNMILRFFSDFAMQTEPAEALKRLNQCRILCAVRKGLYGTEKMNDYLERLLSKQYPTCPIPVMITKNDQELGVSNGDVGVKMPGEDCLYLPAAGEKQHQKIPMILLPETETAFASTIHKAQGSEYSHVVIILPSDISLQKSSQSKETLPQEELLTRELLYTAITRTKQEIFLYAGKQAILKCCSTKVVRQTGLK